MQQLLLLRQLRARQLPVHQWLHQQRQWGLARLQQQMLLLPLHPRKSPPFFTPYFVVVSTGE